jgi:Ca2+-binding EF-hand superfamily protein
MTDARGPDGLTNTKDATWLRMAFDRHDLNRDGQLTLGEFIRLTRWLDATINIEQCEKVFELMDEDSCGKVDFRRFAAWWTHRRVR